MCFHKLTHLTALVLCKSCAIQMERSWRTFPVLQNIYTEVLFKKNFLLTYVKAFLLCTDMYKPDTLVSIN